MKYTNFPHLFTELQKSGNEKKVFAEIAGKVYTYGQLNSQVEKTCTLLFQSGLRTGDRVIVSTKNDYYTSLLFLSLLRAGLTAVLIDEQVSEQRAQGIIKQSNPQAYILEGPLFAKWGISEEDGYQLIVKEPVKKGMLFKKLLKKKTQTIESNLHEFPAILDTLTEIERLPETIGEETLAYILFTSGTTAQPKGVMISHKNLLTHLETLSHTYGINSESRLLNILMLYHADGIIQGPILAFYNQATVYRPLEFDIQRIGELFSTIYKFRITHFIAVPTILALLNKFSEGYEESFQTDEFQFIVSVASHIERKLWEEFEEKFRTRIVNVYGLTETVAGSLFCGPAENHHKIGTVGKPIDCEAKIIDETGVALAAGQEGELLLKGDHISPGYFGNVEASKDVHKDGWLYTGDIAVVDSKGFYTITGRKKNIIISGGVNIHPEEVSEIINTHPEIMESVCLSQPDEVFGEKLICCAVLQEHSQLDSFQLIEFCRQNMEHSKVPAQVFFFDSLPKGLSGKVQLNAVKALLEEQHKSQQVGKDLRKDIFLAASEAFKVPVEKLTIGDTSQSIDGWDSMAHLFFITTLEKQYKIRFSTAEIMIMNSLQSAENILKKKMIEV